MKRPVIILIILLLMTTGITAKKAAIPQDVCTPKCGCVVQENAPVEEPILNKAESAVARMIEL